MYKDESTAEKWGGQTKSYNNSIANIKKPMVIYTKWLQYQTEITGLGSTVYVIA